MNPNQTSKEEAKVVTIESLLEKQKALRDLIYVRPYNLKEIESKSIDLCDAIIDLCDAIIDFYELPFK